MSSEIRRDFEYLILFFLLWASVNLWVLIKFPQIKELDATLFAQQQLVTIFLLSLVSIYGLVMSAVYINRLQKKVNLGGVSAKVFTLLYVLSVILFGLVSSVFILLIFYKIRKMDLSKEKDEKV